MAENRYRMADQYTGPDEGRRSDMNDDRLGGGAAEDVRGIADEDDEEFEEDEDLEDEEENDESF